MSFSFFFFQYGFFHPAFKAQNVSFSLHFLSHLSCRYAWLQRPIHQVAHHPESLSSCLYFPENQPNSVPRRGVWLRARLSFLSTAQSSKLEASQISKRSRRRRPPGWFLLLCGAEVAMSGGPEHMGLAVRVTCSTNTKSLKASARNVAHKSGNKTELWGLCSRIEISSLFLRVCVWQALRKEIKEDMWNAGLVKQSEQRCLVKFNYSISFRPVFALSCSLDFWAGRFRQNP